jgi:hypothetical protein
MSNRTARTAGNSVGFTLAIDAVELPDRVPHLKPQPRQLMTLTRRLAGAGIAALSVMALAVEANATPMNGLPPSSGINATDTIAVCQLAGGCGASNPLVKMPLSAVLGTVGSTISGTTTLGNSQNNETLPVTGKGYTITLPPSTSSTLPPGSRITLSAASGASVDLCVASGSVFDSNSSAPLSSGICASGSGVVLIGGERLEVSTESGNNYFAWLSLSSGGGGNSWAVGSTTTASRSLVGTDAGHMIPVDCILDDCAITLPASTFAAGTQIDLTNISGSTVVPIALVNSSQLSSSCLSGSCASLATSFAISGTGHGVIISVFNCASNCAGNNPTVTGITDTLGNAATCAFVVGAANNSRRFEQWVCPNTSAAGADTWTVSLSGSASYVSGTISEWSGMATSSPTEGANTGTSTTTSVAISTSGTLSHRNDLIYGTINGSGVAGQQLAVPSSPTNSYDEYWLFSGAAPAVPTLTWTQSTSGFGVETIAAYKAAQPLSLAAVKPASGVSIYGAPVDSSGYLPLMPGAEVLLTVDASGNYEAQYLTPPQGLGMVDEITAASWTPSNPWDCYKTDEYSAWGAPQTVTIPVMVPGCVLNMIQGGSQAPKIVPGSGIQLGAYPAGYQHLAGQNAAGFVQTGGGGNVAIFGGQLAQ